MNFIQACDDKERIKKIVLLFYLVFCMEKKKERENKNKRYNRRIKKKGAIETRIVEQACNLCVTGTFFWVEKYHKGHIMSHFFTL